MPILTPEERLGGLLAGKYQLERILGEGGMGVVFEGIHTWTSRKVAVKLLHPTYQKDETIARRFLQEARTATALRHPNVVDVLDLGSEQDGTVYLVMELLSGEPLSDMLARGPLPLGDALCVLLPTMSAIATAHDKSFIHRDLKPENIFLHREGGDVIPKVLDFGLAKVLEQGGDARTRTGLVMGTPYYIAPEQAQGDPRVGPPADVWAMGVVLYEALSGKVPFGGDTATAVVLKACTEEPRWLGELVALHPTIVNAVHTALQKQPELRHPDMRSFAVALIEAAHAAGQPVATPKGLLTETSAIMRAPPRPSTTQPMAGFSTGPIEGAPAPIPPPVTRSSGSGAGILLGVAAGSLLALAAVGITIGYVLTSSDEDVEVRETAAPAPAVQPEPPRTTPVLAPVAAPAPAAVAPEEPAPQPASSEQQAASTEQAPAQPAASPRRRSRRPRNGRPSISREW